MFEVALNVAVQSWGDTKKKIFVANLHSNTANDDKECTTLKRMSSILNNVYMSACDCVAV